MTKRGPLVFMAVDVEDASGRLCVGYGGAMFANGGFPTRARPVELSLRRHRPSGL
jgi:hypothetical protein